MVTCSRCFRIQLAIVAKAMALVAKSPEEITSFLTQHYNCKIRIRKTVTIDRLKDTDESFEVTRYKLFLIDSRPPHPETLLIKELSIIGL